MLTGSGVNSDFAVILPCHPTVQLFGATEFIPYVRLTFINIYSTFIRYMFNSVCLLGRGVGWCVKHSNSLTTGCRVIFSSLIQRNLSVCRCMATLFIIFCGYV